MKGPLHLSRAGEVSFSSAETQLSLTVVHDGVVEFQRHKKGGSLFMLEPAQR